MMDYLDQQKDGNNHRPREDVNNNIFVFLGYVKVIDQPILVNEKSK